MRLAVDASTLVAELLRERGRALFQRTDLELLVAAEQWEETERGLANRLEHLRARMPAEAIKAMIDAAMDVVRQRFWIVPNDIYAEHEKMARERVRDETDWPTVALVLATDAAILTSDPDFLGSGVPTWTYETLAAELARREPPPTA